MEGIHLEKGFKKLSLLALALGITVGGVPGFASASGSTADRLPGLSHRALTEKAASVRPVISSKINTASSNKINVIVQLSNQPAAVGKYAAKHGNKALAAKATEANVVNQQTNVLNGAKAKGIDFKINFRYDTVLNGFELTVPANKLPDFANIPGVVSIHENNTWYVMPDETPADVASATYNEAPIKQIAADWAWAQGYTGKGLKIGVIDTGVDYTHPDIKDAYKGGYDSFYRDNDPYEEPPVPSEGFPGTSHGTHVSGTIIGQFKNQTSDIVQKGIAYGAELHVYKVLGRNADDPTRASGTTAQVIDGIEHAVNDNMDVLNLSLGSDAEKDTNSLEAIALNNAALAGITSVIANGNAGPGYSTMGSPASAQLGISVGAVTSDSKNFNGKFTPTTGDSVVDAAYANYGDFNMMAWTPAYEDFNAIFGDSPYEIVYAGLGYPEDYKEDVTGKIVFVSRGTIPFVDKIAVAKEKGAKAIIIYNGRGVNGAPDLSETISQALDGFISIDGVNPYVMEDSYEFIPTLNIKGTEGRALARMIVQQGKKVSITFDSAKYSSWITPGDKLADFTSFGPNFDSSMSIKPDISAPGVNVMSTWPAYGKYNPEASYDQAYNRNSGTSMATPHVAGLALLIKEAHPDYSPFDIRAALANTADALDATSQYGYHDYYFSGPGRANVKNAILTPALLTAVEPITIVDPNFNDQDVINYNPTASFGLVAPGAAPTKLLELKNTSNEALTYQASIEWLPQMGDKDLSASLSSSTISIAAGEQTTFTLKLAVGADVPAGTWYEGSVVLQAENLPSLRLPFVVHVGDELPAYPDNVIDQISLTNKVIYPNRGSQNSTDLSYRFSGDDVNFIQYLVADLDGNVLGELGHIYTGSDETYFDHGLYEFKGINGTYIDLNKKRNNVKKKLPDGEYSIYIYATLVDKNLNQYVDGNNVPYVEEIGITSFKVDNSRRPR